MQNKNVLIFIFLFLLIFGSSCGISSPPNNSEQNTSTGSTPAPTQNIPERAVNPLIICLGETPNTYNLYGQVNQAAETLFSILYPPPISLRNYQPIPTFVESIPNFEDGSLSIQQVLVNSGEIVLNHRGQPQRLENGVFLYPSGCQNQDCVISFSGDPVEMDQLIVTYRLIESLTWSDGSPVQSSDSIYSFELNQSSQAPTSLYRANRTASYQNDSENNLVWTGIPGFLPSDFHNFIWPPLPQHAWGDITSMSELSPEQLISYGPFSLTSAGENQLQLSPNAYFIGETEIFANPLLLDTTPNTPQVNLDRLLSGECDIIDPTALAGIDLQQLTDLENEVQLSWSVGTSWEVLNFGIIPQSYDDGYSMWAADRADFFGDLRVRQAIAQCIDRQAIIDQLAFGQAAIMQTFMPPNHPLQTETNTLYAYNPENANTLLTELGWILSSNGIRYSQGVENVLDSTLFELDYYTLDTRENLAIAEIIQQNLQDCGIMLNIAAGEVEQLFATGPNALLFGRNFDLAQFSWQLGSSLACNLFLGEAIPGADLELHPYSWGGWNLTGWQSPEYDQACQDALHLLPGQNGYTDALTTVQEIFSQNLPAIPLFLHPQVIAARPDLCNLVNDSTAGPYWNIELIGYGDFCDN